MITSNSGLYKSAHFFRIIEPASGIAVKLMLVNTINSVCYELIVYILK